MFTRNHRRRMYCVLALLTTMAGFHASPAKAVGTWTDGPPNPWDSIASINLLTDGRILVGGYANPFPNIPGTVTTFNDWYMYTPDAQGNYADGTWSQVQPPSFGSLYNVSWTLGDGRYWMGGGEYTSNDGNPNDPDPNDHVQVYDPTTNSWTKMPDGPMGNIGDTGASMLADGRLLVSDAFFSPQVGLFDPSSNNWTAAAQVPWITSYQGVGSGDEQGWQLLADNSVLQAYTNPGYRYLPQNDAWLQIDQCPISITTSAFGFEQGPILYLPNNPTDPSYPSGDLVFTSDHGAVALYTPPSSPADVGSWKILNNEPNLSSGATGQTNSGDTPASIEPSGKVLMVLCKYNPNGPGNGQAVLYEYDPSTDTYASVPDPITSYTTPGFTRRLLNLPNGQIMMVGGGNDIHFYTPADPPIDAARPEIMSVISNGDGSYQLTGTQLSGLNYGSTYGDDEYMATNFPIVTLTDASNNVYFCRTYGLSSHGLFTGTTPETVDFTPPAGLPNGSYTLKVSVNGLTSSTSVQYPIQDFSMAASNDVSIGSSASGSTTITVTPNNGFSGSVALAVSGLPNGVSAALQSPTTTSTDIITLSASGAAAGTTQILVTGQSGNMVRTLTLNLTITDSVSGAPGNLTAKAGDAAVALKWSAVTGASTYNVYRGTTAGGEGGSPIASGIAGTQFVDTGVAAGTKFFYTVAGVNGNGVSAMSSEVSATPLAQAPDAPSGLAANATGGHIALTWNASPLATSYTVSYSTTSGQELSGSTITGITGTTLNVDNLTFGTTYYFVVQGVDIDGTGVASTEASAVAEPAAPVSPAGLAVSGNVGGDTQVDLGWLPVSTADSYSVYAGTSPGGEDYSNPVMTKVTGSTATVTGLADGTKYYFTVESVNAGGNSPPSNEVFATPNPVIPSAPVLTGTPGFQQVSLSWTAPAEATFYDVYESSGTGSFVKIASEIPVTSFVVPKLRNNTSYSFAVDAGNQGGVSPMSNVVTLTPQFAGPTNLTATPGEASVALSWSPTQGAITYDIYMGTTAGGEGAIPVQGAVSGTTFTVTGLTDGTTYYFVVRGVANGQLGLPSNEASATPTLTAPTAPTGLSSTAGNAQVTLAWSSNTPGVTFNVYQGTTPGGENSTPVQTGLTSPAATVTGLTNGTTYYFTVAAVNGAGTSPASNETSATPVLPAPGTPVLSATIGDQKVDLSWTAASDATSYNVYMGTSAGGENSTPIASNVATTTYEKTGLTDNTPYYFIVKAVNSTGTSPASNEVSAVPNPPPPAAPALTGTAGNAQVSLSWNAPSGATSYNVYVGTTAGGESTTPLASNLTATSYVDTHAVNDTTYYYIVRAAGSGGLGAASNEVSAKPEPPAPPAVTGLTAASGDKQVTLAWTAATGATGYNIYQSATPGGETDPPTATSTTAAATIKGLNDGVKYYFTVKAVNTGGTSPQSTEVSAIPSAPVQFRSGINFFSVPFDYSSMSIDDALGGSGIQVATWQPNLDSYAITPTPPADHLHLGVGYWSTFTSGLTTASGGTPADPTKDFTINLQTGWNSIGDPFTVSVPISNLTFVDGTQTFDEATAGSGAVVFGTFYGYNQASNSYRAAQSIDPGSGYWVYAFSNTTMTVPHP